MAKDKKAGPVTIRNKRARYEYEILDDYTAGLQLMGTEIKSIRQGKASISEGYCYFVDDELFIKQMHIAEYKQGGHYNHDPYRERKLLLKKAELKKLNKKSQEKGLSIIPLKLFINERGFAKIQIGLAKGKKVHDKRESIKEKDLKRDMKRINLDQ